MNWNTIINKAIKHREPLSPSAMVLFFSITYETETLTLTVMSLFMNLCNVIRSDYAQEQKKMRSKADRKLLRVIRKKEISLGYKYDDMTVTPQ